ncbi:unnamed protein product, partial [Prorocentrum cordatum]
ASRPRKVAMAPAGDAGDAEVLRVAEEGCPAPESTSTTDLAPAADHLRAPSAAPSSAASEGGPPPDLCDDAPPPAAPAPGVQAPGVQTRPTTPPASKERGAADQVPACLERLVSGGSSRLLSMPCSDLAEDAFGGFLASALSELRRSVVAEHDRAVQAALLRGCTSPAVRRQSSGSSIEEVPDDARRTAATAQSARAASPDCPARELARPRRPSSLQSRRFSDRQGHLEVVVPSAPGRQARQRTALHSELGYRRSSGDHRPRRAASSIARGACSSESPRRSPSPRTVSQELPWKRRTDSHGAGRSLTGQPASQARPAAAQARGHEPPDDRAEGSAHGRSGGGRGARGRRRRRTLTSSSACSGASEGSVVGCRQDRPPPEAAEGQQGCLAASEGHDGEFELLHVWESAKKDGALRGVSFWRRCTLGAGSSPGRTSVESEAEPRAPSFQGRDGGAWHAEWSPLRSRWWVMPPNSRRRLAWDALSMLCILYDLVMAPLEVLNEQYSGPSPMHWVTMLFWTLDIPASCISGYTLPNGTEVHKLRLIWRRYATSWLLPDAAMVGADWMEALLHNALPKGWRVLRMIRLLRLLRLRRVLSLLIMRMQSERAALVFGIAQTLLAILFLAHGMGCIWAGLGRSEGAQGWVAHAADGGELSVEQTYLLAMHWALTNFAGTVNLGPRSWKERVYAIVSLVFGFLVASAFVSIITSNMTRLSIRRTGGPGSSRT